MHNILGVMTDLSECSIRDVASHKNLGELWPLDLGKSDGVCSRSPGEFCWPCPLMKIGFQNGDIAKDSKEGRETAYKFGMLQ